MSKEDGQNALHGNEKGVPVCRHVTISAIQWQTVHWECRLTLLRVDASPRARHAVEPVGDDATSGSRDDVEQSEDGSDLTSLSLTPLGLMLEEISGEDRVDGKLSAESASVAVGDFASVLRHRHRIR